MLRPAENDPFDTTNILTLPPLVDKDSSWSGFQFQAILESSLFHLPESEGKELTPLTLDTFRLALEDVSLESLETSSASAYDTADDDNSEKKDAHLDEKVEDGEDIWSLPAVRDASRTNKLMSWDHFLKDDHKEPPSRYLAEATSKTFDAVLALDPVSQPAKILPTDAYLEAMFQLSLGRSSRYMRWDEQHSEFVPTAEGLTVSGYTPEIMSDFQDVVAQVGRRIRLLPRPQITQQSVAAPGMLAFDAALRSIITAVSLCLERQRETTTTLLQLQGLLDGPGQLLAVLEEVCQAVQRCSNDNALVSRLCATAEALSSRHSQYTKVFNCLLSAGARPLLSQLGCELGLQVPLIEQRAADDDAEASPWTGICSNGLVQLIAEVRESLKLLRGSSIAAQESFHAGRPKSTELDLSFTWDDLTASQTIAREFEARSRLTKAANIDQSSPSASFQVDSPSIVQQRTDADPMIFQQVDFQALPPSTGIVDTPSYKIVSDCFLRLPHNHAPLSIPYDQVFALSLTPIVNAQHRILSYSALKMLYEQCHLRQHLKLLWQFNLLGNGLFAARVSRALFDSDESSGEGRRRDGSTTGLRLQNRDAWPPASSELRLVLMGILSEHVPKTADRELEDALSFSLHDLPEAELERCRDVDSIHALDFLRLHYKPPNSMLESVISNDSINKYDRIFRHLLRVLRLKSLAQTLIREVSGRNALRFEAQDHRFRIEIQNFVTVLANYSQNITINHIWGVFDKRQAEIEDKIQQSDYEGTLKSGRCLEHLRQFHETALDEMLWALLLKEKQAKARTILEELLGIVLRYAAAARSRISENENQPPETTKRFYDEFKQRLSGLENALQGYGGLTEQLLLGLDMKAEDMYH